MSITLMDRHMYGKVRETSAHKINDFSGTCTYCWGLGVTLRSMTHVEGSIYPSEFFQPRDNILGKFWLISLDLTNCELSVEAIKPPPEGTNLKFVFSMKSGDNKISVATKFTENKIGLFGGYVLCKTSPHFWDPASNTIARLKKEKTIYITFTVNHRLPKSNLIQLMALAKDLDVLRKRNMLTDMAICVEGSDDIPAHSAVVSARSTVFAKMFTHNMSEKKTRRVKIKDLQPDVVKALLDFMYCAKIDDAMDVSLGFRLRSAADKYDVRNLQNVCDDFVTSVIDEGSAIAFEAAAEMCGALSVKEAATAFINRNSGCLDFQKNGDLLSDKSFSAIIDIMETLRKLISNETAIDGIS